MDDGEVTNSFVVKIQTTDCWQVDYDDLATDLMLIGITGIEDPL